MKPSTKIEEDIMKKTEYSSNKCIYIAYAENVDIGNSKM